MFPLGLGERGLECGGHAQAARDAREDLGDVFCAEANRDPEDGHAGGTPGQILRQQRAVADEFAEDTTQAGGAGGRVGCLILVGIGGLGERGCVCRGGHERNKNIC